MFGPHAAGSIIVHTIHAGRFLFDCTVSLTAVCGQQKESAVMVFILSKLKCFFRLLQSAALHYWQGVCRAGWLNLSIVRNRERFLFPARPPACCSGCPHRAEVSLWLPLGLPAMGSPAPDAACCLPSPVTVFRSTPYGQAGHGEAPCPAQLYQGETS